MGTALTLESKEDNRVAHFKCCHHAGLWLGTTVNITLSLPRHRDTCVFFHMQMRKEPFPQSVPKPQLICAAAFRPSSHARDATIYSVRLPFARDQLRQMLDCLQDNHWVSRDSSSKVGARINMLWLLFCGCFIIRNRRTSFAD